jgi:hypothetical protein
MNRRQVLELLSSALTASGVAASCDTAVYCEEDHPMLAVIHCSVRLDEQRRETLRDCWNQARKFDPRIPACVVMEPGLRLEMMRKTPC